MFDNAKNFAKVTVSTGYDDVATSVVLSGSEGVKLPSVPFNAVWWNSTDYNDPTDDPNREIVRVTAIATDTLTVTRAQEGTSGSTKNTATKVYKMIAGLTALGVNDFLTNRTDSASVLVAQFVGARATPAANDEIYQSFIMNDSGSAATEFARIVAKGTTVTATAEVGSLDFYTMVAGTLTNQFRLITGAIMPTTNAGLTLGIATNNWGNVFLKNAAVVAFRNAGNSAADVTLTHATGSLTFAGTTDFTLNQAVATTGSPNALEVVGAAHTTLTASTEASSILIDLDATVEFATGALTLQRAVCITAPTYGFVGASTLATAATFCVTGSPIAGANATLTRSYSILSQNGNVSFTMNSNAALTVDFLAQNSVGTTRTVTFKGALSAASANADFTFATTGTTRTAGSLLAVVNNATTRFAVAFNGAVTITQAVGTTGAPACFNITGGAHTTLTAGGSFTDISWALARTVQMATGAVSFAKIINITAPTLAFVGASTITNAATLYISGAPTAGTNATITSPYAFYSASGINAFGGDVRFLQQSTEFLVYGTQTSTTYFIIRGNQSAAGTGSDVRIGTSATRTAGWILQLSNVNTTIGQWDYTGGYEMVQGAGATGVRHSLKITAGAHTNQTASTEASEILFDLSATKQFATGAIAGQRSIRILAPTYAFVGASTITDAATLYVNGAPTAGTNATITNAFAFWVDLGTSRFDGMLDLSNIAAGSANLKITATSDTPTVAFTGGANAPTTAPAGYMEINVGGNARYIPYWA